MALEATMLIGRGLTKLSVWIGCDKLCFASQLSNHIFKIKHISSTRASFWGRAWHRKQRCSMEQVSKSCLGGQAGRNYVLPHNYKIRSAKSNAFHQLTLVLGRVGGTGTNDFEGEAFHQFTLVSGTHFINSP